MPASILVVEDEPAIQMLVATNLRRHGHTVVAALDGEALLATIADDMPDLILLDFGLPGMSGIELLQTLRQMGHNDLAPIIMLTARGEATDRVVGLELGADDYVVKPFDPRELVARIHTVLRRSLRGSAASGNPQQDVHFDGWTLSHLKRELTTPQQLLVPLSNAEYRLLCTFLERPQRILSREQLLDAARGRTVEAFDRSIDLLVSRLRQKLGDDPKAPRIFGTSHGEGYVFTALLS